jgi:D-alanine-D-alanine ligase
MSAGPWRVAVLMGGWSAERQVSLTSGAGIVKALEERGHTAIAIDMGATPAEGRDLPAKLLAANADVVFNALHGVPGEDGTVQGLMDVLGLTYTHSGLATSVIAIDKQLTKQHLVPHGIPMPGGVVVSSESLFAGDPLLRPYVVKPVNEGSSVGVAIVTADGNYGNPIGRDVQGPWQEFDELLAEPFIRGRELTVAVLGDRALCVTELRPKSGFYDYDAKYTDGMTDHICPADVPADIAARMMEIALEAHRLLGCKGTSRSDFRWDDEAGLDGIFLLEVNTQPGMTPLSLVPEQARQLGMSYGELVETVIADALADARKHKGGKACGHEGASA